MSVSFRCMKKKLEKMHVLSNPNRFSRIETGQPVNEVYHITYSLSLHQCLLALAVNSVRRLWTSRSQRRCLRVLCSL